MQETKEVDALEVIKTSQALVSSLVDQVNAQQEALDQIRSSLSTYMDFLRTTLEEMKESK